MARGLLALALAAGLSVAVSQAGAAVTFTGVSGSRAASATFDIVGGNLEVVLDNTSSADALVPVDILTAVFFNLSGSTALSPQSATSQGPTFLSSTQINVAGTNVGGEWAYATFSDAQLPGINAGISSTGVNLFGSGNFSGGNLAGPDSVDGLQYGITTTGDNSSTGNGGLASKEVTKHAVKFVLTVPSGFSLSQISGVLFQYGTSLSEPRVPSDPSAPPPPGVPEPATLLLAAMALLGATAAQRRRA